MVWCIIVSWFLFNGPFNGTTESAPAFNNLYLNGSALSYVPLNGATSGIPDTQWSELNEVDSDIADNEEEEEKEEIDGIGLENQVLALNLAQCPSASLSQNGPYICSLHHYYHL